MVVIVVGCSGGCPAGCRACMVPPGPALHAASTTTVTAGSAAIDRLQPRQARTGGRRVVAADTPRRDDQLITIPSLRSAPCSWRQAAPGR